MKNLYIVKGYCSDEHGNKEVRERLIVSAESAESALGYFTEGEDGWKNYTDEGVLIGAEKVFSLIGKTLRIEVLPLKPDIVVIE